MSATFKLTVFRWRIATWEIRIDIDRNTAAATQPVIDGAVKKISRRWARSMTS